MTAKNEASSKPRKTKLNIEAFPPSEVDNVRPAEETLREYQMILSIAEEGSPDLQLEMGPGYAKSDLVR